MKCKIRITKDIPGIFQRYQPQLGEIYDAEYIQSIRTYRTCAPVCVINMLGKRIIVRQDEFEIVG